MDSVNDDLESDTPPKKKLKITDSTDSASEINPESTQTIKNAAPDSQTSAQIDAQEESKATMLSDSTRRVSYAAAETEKMRKELAIGIEIFVSEDAGFQGTLRRRYHDFIVHEIMPNGKVVRLDDPEMLKAPAILSIEASDDHHATTSTASTNEKTETVAQGDPYTGAATESHGSGSIRQGNETPSTSIDTSLSIDPDLELIRDLGASEGKNGVTALSLDLTPQKFEQLKRFFDLDQIKRLAIMFKDISLAAHRDVAAYGSVESQPIDDKFDRKNAHQIVRTVFRGQIESAHKDGNLLYCTAAAGALSRRGKPNDTRRKPRTDWDRYGGEYMHFSLYKENRDSGDVLGFLTAKLNSKNKKIFEIAGMKDRRAATVQRVSAHRLMADRFLHLNNIITQARVGDCSYSKNKLQLGDLAGNEFILTLRDCAVRIPKSNYTTLVPDEIDRYVRQGMQDLREKGFINYYGLQRFGSFATRTDIVGQYIISGDYKAAVDTILEFSTSALKAAETEDSDEKVSSDDRRRAQALNWFQTQSTDIKTILQKLPRRFSAEHAIVSFLGNAKDRSNPYYRGALETIPRGIRSLYPHAYQSLIWNLAATHRWQLAPGKLIPGDLILAHRAPQSPSTFQTTKYDAQGDPIFEPGHHDRASVHEQYEGGKAYALTEENIKSDRYSIFDVILPQPGFDVTYPSFMLDFYKTTMAKHGDIDPLNMRRNWRDASLPGTYRKLLGRPFESWSFEQVWYHEEEAKIALTDLDLLEAKQKQKQKQIQAAAAVSTDTEKADLSAVSIPASGIALATDIVKGERLAIVLKFQLPSSTYATMALRELMKPGPVEFKPEFSRGR